ncbi:MAG TPA: pyruvate dehydrogenase (acetyl-transferring) E1 component subunit alpha [Armatimonadota bacterium]
MARRGAAAVAEPATEEAAVACPYSNDELVDVYRKMLEARRFEERSAQAYTQAKIGGYCHLYIGQEASGAGFLSALRPNWDYVITAYRDHAAPLFMGSPPGPLMAELFGKATGVSGGKGGSMHLYDAKRGFMGGWGIVGGQIPIAIGLAFAAKYRNEDRVTICFIGDGAAPIGAFHESLNLAGILDLPIVFVIENNAWAMGTALKYTNSTPDLHMYGEGYNIEHRPVDGMDLFAVKRCADDAVAKARAGKPQLIESITYRYRGHSMADAGQYRTKEEVQEWRERDPVEWLAGYLKEHGILTEDELGQINDDVREAMKAAVEFADQSPLPGAEELYKNVYV